MRKFVPLEKQSKSAQKAYNKQRRNTWGPLSPVTRAVKGRTGYDRKRFRTAERSELSKEGFFY